MCSSRKNDSPIYEIPIFNHFNNFNKNRTPPPVPPRRRRLIKIESGELVPSTMHQINQTQQTSQIKNNTVILYDKANNTNNEIEPLFTVEINIKNERNGVSSNRKIYL